jgi:hypothetical protein
MMTTYEAVVKVFLDGQMTKRAFAKRLGMSVTALNLMLKEDELSNAARQLIALGLGITLYDFDEIVRMTDEEYAAIKQADVPVEGIANTQNVPSE